MGVRTDQHMGLSAWASEFVQGQPILVCVEVVVQIYPDGTEEKLEPRPVFASSVQKEPSGEHYVGMFEDEYPLNRYTFPDGRVYFERLQNAPWSAGPVFFLALQDEKGDWVPESLWPESAIEAA